ncbi:calcium-binding protein [Psychromarinibacter sp. C21-152]|uniref:Calcium-binding protein n=1 Tax=Psychromarinibacter sediminicola TaxID=3033385 RepID=A0AAE3T941_9RHOB|nr:calcium-binding protein [Psychromarinibacter sediminicola]MDF0601807.1 calcium-binding protein [Psychromarinibacter sediminicola]
MLAALLLLGVLPFAAMPLMETRGAADDDDTGPPPPDPEPESAEDWGPLLDEAAPAAEAEGARYVLDAGPGDAVLPAFEPGVDSVEIDLTGQAGDLYFDTAEDAEGATLSFSLGEDVLTLRFPGLSAVPAGDVTLALDDEATGERYAISLRDAALFLGEAEAAEAGMPTGGVLDPTDPEEPDGPGPETEGDVLDPSDPEAPGDPGPEVTGEVLDPTDPDAPDVPDGTAGLAELMARDSGNLFGLGAALDAADAAGLAETRLGDGDDTLTLPEDGSGEAGRLDLSEGTPVLSSQGTIAVVDAGDGADSVTAGDAAAYLFGGAGDDALHSGEGAAALYGGDGRDVLDGQASAAGVYLDGGAGDDTVTGGAGADVLEGGEPVPGMAGNDVMAGGAGDDLIRGGLGADQLEGGDGDDVIDHLGLAEEREVEEHREFAWHVDGGEVDSLSGGAGDDTLILGDADIAEGGAGDDLFWVYTTGADPVEVTDFALGEDFLRVSLDPQIGENGDPAVTVEPSADGADALVTVNGDLVAILRGAPGATASDVYAEVAPDIFPAGPGT